MSSMPKCKGCGLYVHWGDCYCEECANKKDKLIEQMKGGIIKLRKKLNGDGEYSICRTDGKPMELFEVLDIDTILKEIDEALKLLE